jgi:hypothetical protein
MRLHGPAKLRVRDREGVDQRRDIEAHEPADRSGRPECAGGCRPEKPQRRFGGEAETGAQVDPERNRVQKVAPRDVARALGMRQGRRQQHRHRVHDRGFVHAVELAVVDLVAIAERCRRRRQARAAHPDAGLVALAPFRLRRDQLGNVRAGAADHGDPERIQDERLRSHDRGRRQVVVADRDDVLGQADNRIHTLYYHGGLLKSRDRCRPSSSQSALRTSCAPA